jgi:Recombination endonuclease VII
VPFKNIEDQKAWARKYYRENIKEIKARHVSAEYRRKNTERARQYRAADPIAAAAKSRANLLKRVGHTAKSFEVLLTEQNGCCAICASPMTPPYIDHDHAHCGDKAACSACTRGLLCRLCNVGLGHFRDSPALLISAVRYLRRFSRR